MYKKIVFCLTAITFAHGMLYCSENSIPTGLWTKTVNLGKDLWSRPFAEAMFTGFRKGGKHALMFSAPIIMLGIANKDSADVALLFPTLGIAGALTGSTLGSASVLFPLTKKNCTKHLPEYYIKRAAKTSAHTGTFLGALALTTYAIVESSKSRTYYH